MSWEIPNDRSSPDSAHAANKDIHQRTAWPSMAESGVAVPDIFFILPVNSLFRSRVAA
jgi:hypothetical protein